MLPQTTPHPDRASTLERLAARGARDLYQGELARGIVRLCRERGGAITREDLAAYRVVGRRPVRVRYREQEFVSNPPPSSGGVLIAYGLALLDRLPVAGGPGSAEAVAVLVEVMREQARARERSFASD